MDTAISGTVTMAMATGREEIGIETENVTVIVETTDAATSVVTSMTAGSVVMTMTVRAETTARRNGDIVPDTTEVVKRALLAVVGVRGGMGLVLQSGGPLHLRVRFLCPSGGARLLDGMSMLRDTNNIRLCKPNKQVG